MKAYKQEPAEEPPMADWPEPSPDDIEPSPEEPLTRLCDSMRMQCQFTTSEWAAIEVALKESIRERRRVLRQLNKYGDRFFSALTTRNLRADIAALRALRNHKVIWHFDK